jgi:hypothetical protein
MGRHPRPSNESDDQVVLQTLLDAGQLGRCLRDLLVQIDWDTNKYRRVDSALQRLRLAGKIRFEGPTIGWKVLE